MNLLKNTFNFALLLYAIGDSSVGIIVLGKLIDLVLSSSTFTDNKITQSSPVIYATVNSA